MNHCEPSQRLCEYLQAKVPYLHDVSITNMQSLTPGWECEIYALDLGFVDGSAQKTMPMILRLYPGLEIPLLGPKHLHEFNTMRQLAHDGYPVPAVYLVESDEEHLGSPFIIMDRIAGPTLGDAHNRASPAEREELLTEMCQLMVDLHNLNWRNYAEGQLCELGAIKLEVERHRRLARYAGADYAMPALDWLDARAQNVTGARLALAHWDFHSSNIIMDDAGRCFVIDWGNSYVTDYRFDLAWSSLFLGDLAPKFVALYAERAEKPVEQFEFFLAFAYFRRILTMIVALDKGAETLGMRPGAEIMIRRQAPRLRTLYDLWVAVSGVEIPHVGRSIEV